MTITANDLLMGSGAKSASFLEIGASITGRIAMEPKAAQQTDPKDNSLKTFANGDPMMQVVVQLATDQRDPAIEDDDGLRTVYIKSNMLKAVREAVKASGAKGMEVGGTLTVTYVADGEKTNKAFNPPKLYTAAYKPPSGGAANAVLMGDVPTSPAPAGIPGNVDPAVWERLTPEQRAAVLAASAPAGGDKPSF
jgi:hypothetical protein